MPAPRSSTLDASTNARILGAHLCRAIDHGDDAEADRLRGDLALVRAARALASAPRLTDEQRTRLVQLMDEVPR